jgi:hypothetical protein
VCAGVCVCADVCVCVCFNVSPSRLPSPPACHSRAWQKLEDVGFTKFKMRSAGRFDLEASAPHPAAHRALSFLSSPATPHVCAQPAIRSTSFPKMSSRSCTLTRRGAPWSRPSLARMPCWLIPVRFAHVDLFCYRTRKPLSTHTYIYIYIYISVCALTYARTLNSQG